MYKRPFWNFQPEPLINSEQKPIVIPSASLEQNGMLAEAPGKVLNLTLHKMAFEVMVTGEKKEEFRRGNPWITSRLMDEYFNPKTYNFIKFTNGYGSHRPFFICKYEGFTECYMAVMERRYSNGLIVNGIGKGDFIIYCGQIIEVGNW